MTKVLLGLGFVLVVALAMVAGAFIYTTWFDNRQEIKAHIVAGEDMPNMTKEDIKALVKTRVIIGITSTGVYLVRACPPSTPSSPRYIGAGTWIVGFGEECTFTVDDRTGKVSP